MLEFADGVECAVLSLTVAKRGFGAYLDSTRRARRLRCTEVVRMQMRSQVCVHMAEVVRLEGRLDALLTPFGLSECRFAAVALRVSGKGWRTSLNCRLVFENRG